MLLETLQIPSVEKVRQHIKADLKRITAWDYSAKDVYDCLVAYLQQYARIRSGVDSFILYIQKAPGISPYVHSVRSRLKLPLHLAEKLVRKCTDENPEKRRTITQDKLFTLEHGITDLGGVRILHLRKGEWNPIHDQLMLIKNFSIRDDDPSARFEVVEKTAFINKNDWKNFEDLGGKDLFTQDEIVDDHEKQYTSFHYVLQWKSENEKKIWGTDLFIECQVRTLFEEGWGEIDHQVNYPYKSNTIVGGQLRNLNSTARVANEIATELETLKFLPLLVPWDAELRLERSADNVYCLSVNLGWVMANREKAVRNFMEASGHFYYCVIDDKNLNQFLEVLKDKGISNVTVFRIPPEKSTLPVVSDILLLENAIDPVESEMCNYAVVGAPPGEKTPLPEDQMDMLIKDGDTVTRLQKFFDDLR